MAFSKTGPAELLTRTVRERADAGVELLDQSEFRRRFCGGVSKSLFYRLISQGVIPPPLALGGRSFWRPQDGEGLLERLAAAKRETRPARGAGLRRRAPRSAEAAA